MAKVGPYKILEYDLTWPTLFASYAAILKEALGELAMSVEHIGSTSVVGLAAKPIIDIDILISSRLVLGDVIETLADLGYIHEGNVGIPGREAFVPPPGEPVHLYVCSVDTPNLHNHLLLRDYLRARPEVAEAYGNLKKSLVIKHADNREAYTEAKTDFIQSILARAKVEYGFHTFQNL